MLVVCLSTVSPFTAYQPASLVTWQVILVHTKINFVTSIVTECTYSSGLFLA